MSKAKKKAPTVIIPDAPPVAIDKSETLAHNNDTLVTSRGELPPAIFALKGVPCPTCGTAKLGNRCDVCGHQTHDDP